MYAIPWMISVLLWIQVPPPSAGSAAPAELGKARRGIQDQEARELAGLAERLAGKGDSRSASEVRRVAAPARAHGVASRLSPLPEVVSAHGPGSGQRDEWGGEGREERARPGLARRARANPIAGGVRVVRPGRAFGRNRTRPSMPRRRCVFAGYWNGSRTMPRRGGYWDTSLTTAAGPGRSPCDSSRRGTSIIPCTAGFRRTGWLTSRPASFPPPWPGARRSPDGSPPGRPTSSDLTGRIPG